MATVNKLKGAYIALRGVTVRVEPESATCPLCGGPTKVQKSGPRHGRTLSHGEFKAWETVLECKAGCKYPSGEKATRRAAMLVEQFPTQHEFAYDVIVNVGIKRYLEHGQREEIRSALKKERDITISTGEVSKLSRLFLEYMLRLHKSHIKELRAALESDGGYPMHYDATGEDGRGTLFVVFAGWRKWVLDSCKMSTERGEAILSCLKEVVREFGAPCAMMKDMGKAATSAADDLIKKEKLNIPLLVCHAH